MGDLEIIPRRRIEYRGVTLEEMDIDAVSGAAPQIAIVDELAHTQRAGRAHGKRWEDVAAAARRRDQRHLRCERAASRVAERRDRADLGVTVRETVPDWIVSKRRTRSSNLDISARGSAGAAREGKIYAPEKIESALRNFFTDENLTTLRELALREVASSVDRLREAIVAPRAVATAAPRTVIRHMVAMSSGPPFPRALLRKASRIAGRLNSRLVLRLCAYARRARRPHRQPRCSGRSSTTSSSRSR